MELDAEQLLAEISDGKEIADEQIRHIVECLESVETEELVRMPSIDELYSYLLVIGKLKRFEHRAILERYLDATDVLTVSRVLETLCLDWGQTEEYLERVINFALGVGWDSDDDVRLSAIRVLGEYVEGSCRTEQAQQLKAAHRQVVELLIGIFEDQDADSWTRQAAYAALCRAAGIDWEELPGECVALDLAEGSEDIRWDLLAQCRKSLGSSDSSSVNGPPSSDGGSSSSKTGRPGIR